MYIQYSSEVVAICIGLGRDFHSHDDKLITATLLVCHISGSARIFSYQETRTRAL